MTKKPLTERVIMRHILEVRLHRRLFSFFDFRGRMIELATESLAKDRVRIPNPNRFELSDSNEKSIYFVGIDSFGFQIEGSDNLSDFYSALSRLTDFLSRFPEYRIDDGFSRIGVRSMIFRHRRSDTFEDVKAAYEEKLLNEHRLIAEKLKSSITDTSFVLDLKIGGNTANVLTGPATTAEVAAKFFDNKKEYLEFERGSGMFLSIDVAGGEPLQITDIPSLEEKVKEQISNIQTIYQGFKDIFDKE